MGTLRHVAFWVKDAQRMYDFYHQVFDIEQVRSSPNGRSIHVIDGLFNLAFLGGGGARDQERTYGINHIGFTVDDLEGTLARLDVTYLSPVTREPGGDFERFNFSVKLAEN